MHTPLNQDIKSGIMFAHCAVTNVLEVVKPKLLIVGPIAMPAVVELLRSFVMLVTFPPTAVYTTSYTTRHIVVSYLNSK
jgi:hypothetical protein